MDIIPYVRLVFALAIGGILLFIFNNIVGIIREIFPNYTVYGNMVWMLWHGMVFIIIVVEFVRFFMALQKRKVYE